MDEKKSERLEVRLGFQEKSDFVEACESQGDTPSSALRRFIRGYVRRADADLFASAWRGTIGRRKAPLVLGITGVLALGVMAWAGTHLSANKTLSDDAIFSARDWNNDGVLQASEHGLPNGPEDQPNGVLKVLDLDASGTISRDEFMARGRMVFAVALDNGALVKADDPRLTFVEFEFRVDGTQSNTFRNSIVNAGDLDRLVIWNTDGTNLIFEKDVAIRSDGTFEIMSETATFPSSMTVETKENGMTVARPKIKDE